MSMMMMLLSLQPIILLILTAIVTLTLPIKQVHAWSWSRSISTYGPQISGHACVTLPIKTNNNVHDNDTNGGGIVKNDKIYLFGGQIPQPDVIGGAGASVYNYNKGSTKTSSSSSSSSSGQPSISLKEAREESKRLAEESAVAANENQATHDLWVYEKDKLDNNVDIDGSSSSPSSSEGNANDNDWTLIPRKEQGISRPSPRTHAASARLGHMMFLFGGIDPAAATATATMNKQLSDVWTLSLLTNKWSLSQAILPTTDDTIIDQKNRMSSPLLVACAISNTKVALLCGDKVIGVYNDDLPTPSIEKVQVVDDDDIDDQDIIIPVGLSHFACCGIPRTNDDNDESSDKDDNAGHGAVDDLHGYISRANGISSSSGMNYVQATEGELNDVLLYGGSTAGDNVSGFSSDAFRLDTKLWKWTKLTSSSSNRPRALIDASMTSIGKNQCILYGGASLNERQQTEVCDETWLLTIDNNEANWERIANLPQGVVGSSGGVLQSPEGRTLASLIATSPDELVLAGGYNPLTKQTYGGAGGGGTWLLTRYPIDHAKIAMEKAAREQELKDSQLTETEAAASRASDIIAAAGSGMGFDGGNLGVGGLDHVLEEVKTRIWTPLAAPPKLLKELGIQPTRGLLLYGGPGCGKTLLASTLGSILSPFRPITVVNGPELLDKFVGSSEQNLRDIFDNPPDIHDVYKRNETDGGEALSRAAVHVVVMDEFDAIARNRGSGGGGQGDAGVARDSVVNQLLSKMDGVTPLKTTTLVIGLTNKKELIDPALLRPGRFEVQIEIEPPKTVEQRRSIVMVHTKQMFEAGRLQVNNPPVGSAAANQLKGAKHLENNILSYDQLVEQLAIDCDGFSGASIAGVTRAAASRALARSVGRLSGDSSSYGDDSPSSIMDCIVSQDDLYHAMQIVRGRSSSGNRDNVAGDESAVQMRDEKLRANNFAEEREQEQMALNIAQLTKTVSDLEAKLERLMKTP